MNAPVKGSGSGKAGEGSRYGRFDEESDGFVEFDLAGLYRTLRKRVGLIITIAVGVTALVMVAVYQMTPLYTGQAQVLLDRQKTQVVDMEAVMSGLPPDSAAVDSEVEILRSRSLATRVIKAQNLIDDPEFNASLRDPSLLQWIDPRVWVRSLLEEPKLQSEEAREREILNSVVGAFLSRETITRRGVTYVIQIEFRSESPEKAARIANAIADTYILDQLEAKYDATRQANEWLSRRLDELRQQVLDSERAAEIFRAQHDLKETDGLTVSEQQLSELNAQLILARTDLAEAQAKYNRAREIRSSGGSIETVGDVLQSQTISQLRQKQADLARELANLSAKYGPRHPEIINAEAQRGDIERQISAEVGRIMGSLQNDVAVAQTRVASLERSLKEVRGDRESGGEASVQLRELEREAAANRAVYESFLNRFKETSQQGDLQTPDSRVISSATVPVAPSEPKKGLIASVSLTLSLMFGIGVAFLLEHLDNGIQTGRDVEQILGLPHLVSLPAAPAEKGADRKTIPPVDYLLSKPLSAYSESLRSLRSALQLSNVDNPPKIILFTSALPSEGKTTTAASFARAAAASGAKVVLVDCDLRHPSAHKVFGMKRPDEGLVELLAERLDLGTVIVKDTKSELDIIPVATGTANPPDVLGSSQMKILLERLRESYDLVVLDSAPILPVSDSRVLSKLADETVFVVRWNETPRDAALNAIKELRLFDASIAGVVLSVVDTAKQARYGYGDGGYYYGKYSRYYVN